MKTERKAASGTMLTLLLIGMLASALNIQPASGSGTIYIRADGSIDPPTAPISTIDNVTYTFTNNIYDSIVIERDNIVIEGASYTLQGTGTPPSEGINLSERENVTIQNTQIKNFWNGIYFNGSSNNIVSANNITANRIHAFWLDRSSNCNTVSGNTITNNHNGIGLGLYSYSNYNNISGNTITNNGYGIVYHHSSNNSVSRNNITANSGHGLWLDSSSNNNSISRNNIANNGYGIVLYYSSNYNSINGNNITANKHNGIMLHSSYNNSVYHNNFIDNNPQVHDQAWNNPEVPPSINIWDNGYPSGGNYWSDNTREDANSDGINDTPYAIDEDNQDNYPLMNPWTPIEETSPLWTQWWFWTIIAAAVAVSAGALYLLKKREPPKTPHAQKGTDTISVADE